MAKAGRNSNAAAQPLKLTDQLVKSILSAAKKKQPLPFHEGMSLVEAAAIARMLRPVTDQLMEKHPDPPEFEPLWEAKSWLETYVAAKGEANTGCDILVRLEFLQEVNNLNQDDTIGDGIERLLVDLEHRFHLKKVG